MGAYRIVEIGIRRIDGADVNFPFVIVYYRYALPGGPVVKNPPANAGDMDSISGLGRSPGGGNGNPLQYSCLGNLTASSPWGHKRVGHDSD